MNQAPVKAILFDLDDTLWPIAPVIRRAEIELFDWLMTHAPAVTHLHSIESLRARRLALMKENPYYKIDLWSLRHAALTEAFLAAGEDTARVDQAMETFTTARNQVEPFEDVLPALERLGRHVTLGSISNGFADLETIGLAHHFKVSIAAHQIGCAKPDSTIFLAGCTALGVNPAEAVYVGDDLELDVEGAQKAGLRAVWMNRFERSAPPHINPDLTCTTLHELDQWLSRRIIMSDDNI